MTPSRRIIEDGKAVAAQRAINSHDELVEALRHFVDFIAKAKDSGLTPKADYSQCLWEANRALAKASPITCPRCAQPTAAFGLCAECAKLLKPLA